jgi:probable phosphoglycerate mutase
MSIYLIRHGMTAGNAERRLQVPETPLSERGLEQARRLGLRLANIGVERILTSDLERARMTADAVSRAAGVAPDLEPLLQERNFGDHRGLLWQDAAPDIFDLAYDPPGGESWTEFLERAALAWESVARAAAEIEGHLAVVTHGLLYGVLVNEHIGLPDRPRGAGERPNLQIRNTAVTIVSQRSPHRIELLACTAHLEPEG